MPFVPGTPESRLQRSDSKNPATTCKGITAAGKHCRRDIVTPSLSKFKRKGPDNGVVAVLPAGDDEHDGAAAYFCWQHKDQAASLTSPNKDGRQARIVPLQRRTSVDTLAERLGIIDLEDGDEQRKARRHKRKHHTNPRPARKDTLPQKWQDVDGPLLAVGNHYSQPSRPGKKKSQSNVGLFCCVRADDRDDDRPVRPVPMSERPYRASAAYPLSYNNPKLSSPRPPSRPSNRHSSSQPPASPRRPHQPSATSITRNDHPTGFDPPTPSFARPSNQRRPSQTQALLSWISPTLNATTTSALLAELAKPLSAQEEPGYIYIFWLSSSSSPSFTTATSPATLINGSSPASPSTHSHSPRGGTATRTNTILLKIGRAANVQRRMNQWTRQCGYEVSVVRFYPYTSTSTSPFTSPPPSKGKVEEEQPRPVPHSHKVERLIHLELAEKKVRKACGACGKEHREWFEVEASKEGMRAVDEVCRRWCDWADAKGSRKGR